MKLEEMRCLLSACDRKAVLYKKTNLRCNKTSLIFIKLESIYVEYNVPYSEKKQRRVKVTDFVIYLCLALLYIELDLKCPNENVKSIQRCIQTKK